MKIALSQTPEAAAAKSANEKFSVGNEKDFDAFESDTAIDNRQWAFMGFIHLFSHIMPSHYNGFSVD